LGSLSFIQEASGHCPTTTKEPLEGLGRVLWAHGTLDDLPWLDSGGKWFRRKQRDQTEAEQQLR
jgi:hypothetical protein